MPGYQMSFAGTANSVLLCNLCKFPMRDPVQITTCGHRFCDTCLQSYLRGLELPYILSCGCAACYSRFV